MKTVHFKPLAIVSSILLALYLLACTTTLPTTTPRRLELVANPSCGSALASDETAALNISVSSGDPSGLTYEWSASIGKVNPRVGPATVYTASNTPGADVVTVDVKGTNFSQSLACTYKILPPPSPPPTATASPTPTPPVITFQKGIALPAWWFDHYCDPPFGPRALGEIEKLGADSVQLVPTWYQGTKKDNEMARDRKKTATDDSLICAIKGARNIGLAVMLKPHVDLDDGNPRTDIDPNSSQEWFVNYEKMILQYAKIASSNDVNILVVGTEFKNLTDAAYTAQWRDLIAKIRQVYHGRLTYAANWDEYGKVQFWDALDYIGIDAYFPLLSAEDPQRGEILESWTNYHDPSQQISRSWRDEITSFASQKDKPFILTEIGYASQDKAGFEPWNQGQSTNPNPKLQARLYEATLRTFWTQPKFEGMYWWLWDMKPDDQYKETGFHPKELARTLLREWYQLDPPAMPPAAIEPPTETPTATPTAAIEPAAKTSTSTATATRQLAPPPPKPLPQPPPPNGYDWEGDTCQTHGWVAQDYKDSQGIGSVQGSGDIAHDGKCSLKLFARLQGGQHANFSKGETFVDFTKPVSFAGKTITCWVYVPKPEGAGQSTSSPNIVQLFAKDKSYKNNYGTYTNLVEGWNEATFLVGTGDYIDEDFDPGTVTRVGVKIGTSGTAPAKYKYERVNDVDALFYVDSCSW